ncbi:MAG: hypothetical protein CHACPFDD_03400 [Phycisphaerae bacterium]|nr:hypothetical protein [Phycisphaerae bacterium]
METSPGILGRLSEKVLGWIALGLLVALGIAIWQTPADTKQAIWSGVWRATAWLAIVATLPWASRLFMGRVLEQSSNWAGVALVAAYCLADVIAAVCLMTVWPASGWAWFLSAVALAIAGTYNYLVCEYVAEQSGL